MTTEDRINEFDPDNVETISGWVLEYPFVEWVPSSREYPVLPIRRPDGTVRMYSVRGVLGRGGFGIVFLCVETEQQFAIKMPRIGPWDGTTVTDIGLRLDRDLPLDPVAVDQTFVRRVNEQRQALADGLAATNLDQVLQTFRSETSMLIRLRHPNIVPLEFSGEIIAGTSADGVERTLPCIAMPYVRGRRLSEVIADEKAWNLESDFPQVLKTARDLALAVACIHDRRTCHRDLSWNNVMISGSGLPMIIDLGNVSLPEDPPVVQVRYTVSGGIETLLVPYTPGFVAPEHRDGTTIIDGRGDQFSLGVTLYLWCCGKKNHDFQWPFDKGSGESNNPADRQHPVPLRELRRGFVSCWKDPLRTSFEEFSDELQRMMEWHRDDRYPNLRDVAAVFEMILQRYDQSAAGLLNRDELQMDESFRQLCRQVSIPDDESAGCLILQTLVRQARQQIGETIDKIWDAMFETWIDSKLLPLEKSMKMYEEGRQLESNFKTSQNTVLRTFQKAQMTGSAAPRFGGRLQQILGSSLPATLWRHPPDTEDEATLRAHVDGQWDYFNQRQERLAEVDYQLSLYSLQLNELRNRSAAP